MIENDKNKFLTMVLSSLTLGMYSLKNSVLFSPTKSGKEVMMVCLKKFLMKSLSNLYSNGIVLASSTLKPLDSNSLTKSSSVMFPYPDWSTVDIQLLLTWTVL